MKKTFLFILLIVACMTSCKTAKSPVKTYEMPCAELKSGNGVLRAWAVGTSDNEMTARKKAQVAASAELARILSNVVRSTVEDYTTVLSDTIGKSKSLYNERIQTFVNKELKGAVIVCDQWGKERENGMYKNYLVLELGGQETLTTLKEILGVQSEEDKELLSKLFMENIEKSAEAQK